MPARRPAVRTYSFGMDIRQIYSMGDCLGTGNYGTVRVCELRSVHSDASTPEIADDASSHLVLNQDARWTTPAPTPAATPTPTPVPAGDEGSHHQMLLKSPQTPTPEKLACKTIYNSALATRADAAAVHTEIRAMRIADRHPNVVQLRGVHRDREGMHLVMELCPGGDLFEELSRRGHFDESEAAGIFRQLAVGVEYLHSKKIFHRDLKLENCLLTLTNRDAPGGQQERAARGSHATSPGNHRNCRTRNGRAGGGVGKGGGGPPSSSNSSFRGEAVVKIADFGLAVLLEREEDQVADFAGSPFYMSPEQLSGRPYGTKSDIWSLGIILYALFSGRFPFARNSSRALAESIGRGRVSFHSPPWQNVSREARRLVQKILQPDPRLRPSAAEVLRDRWLTNPQPARATWRDTKLTRSLSLSLAPQKRAPEFLPRETCTWSATLKNSAARQLSPVHHHHHHHHHHRQLSSAPPATSSTLVQVVVYPQLAAQVAIARHDSCLPLSPPPATPSPAAPPSWFRNKSQNRNGMTRPPPPPPCKLRPPSPAAAGVPPLPPPHPHPQPPHPPAPLPPPPCPTQNQYSTAPPALPWQGTEWPWSPSNPPAPASPAPPRQLSPCAGSTKRVPR